MCLSRWAGHRAAARCGCGRGSLAYPFKAGSMGEGCKDCLCKLALFEKWKGMGTMVLKNVGQVFLVCFLGSFALECLEKFFVDPISLEHGKRLLAKVGTDRETEGFYYGLYGFSHVANVCRDVALSWLAIGLMDNRPLLWSAVMAFPIAFVGISIPKLLFDNHGESYAFTGFFFASFSLTFLCALAFRIFGDKTVVQELARRF